MSSVLAASHPLVLSSSAGTPGISEKDNRDPAGSSIGVLTLSHLISGLRTLYTLLHFPLQPIKAVPTIVCPRSFFRDCRVRGSCTPPFATRNLQIFPWTSGLSGWSRVDASHKVLWSNLPESPDGRAASNAPLAEPDDGDVPPLCG